MKKTRCNVRNRRGCLWGAHQCFLQRGHVGAHRCSLFSEGTIAKPRQPATVCNFQWRNLRAVRKAGR